MSTTNTTNASATSQSSLNFLLDGFVEETDGVIFAQTVSADGMHLASSGMFDRATHDTFAAIASGLTSLTDGAVENFGMGPVTRQIIETSDGWILLSRMSTTAAIGVTARKDADLGLIGYEMARLAKRLGVMLSPDVIDRLKQSLSL